MPELTDFSSSPLSQIHSQLLQTISRLNAGETLHFLVFNPDHAPGTYAGEEVHPGGRRYLHRSYRSWLTLAEQFGCRMLTPRPYDHWRIRLTFQKLGEDSFHKERNPDKYGSTNLFARIHKEEEPPFYHYYLQALQRLKVTQRRRILALGLNRGDELEPIRGIAGDSFREMEIVGIDLACDALTTAKERFAPVLTTHCHDLNALAELDLGRFDLILSIGTLQSPGIEMKPLIMELVQRHLTPDGALLLGWPNARWIDGELLYGAQPLNYPFSELSLVIKDLFWIKKYLQQHRFRVVITGREYLFLEGTPIGTGRKNG
jgi:hypothetical protein